MHIDTVRIGARFNGPPTSGNGGYTAGIAAQYFSSDVAVRLQSPPPLDTNLSVCRSGESVELRHGELVVASARQASLDLDIPACPEVDEIACSTDRYPTAEEHVLSTCFVCGPARKPGDGLTIFPLALNDSECVASVWRPAENMATEDGLVAPEILWAALDCPGYFAHRAPTKMMLLGSMTGSIKRRPAAQESLVSIGWHIRQEGRKYFSGTALYDQNKNVCAASSQVWIELRTDSRG